MADEASTFSFEGAVALATMVLGAYYMSQTKASETEEAVLRDIRERGQTTAEHLRALEQAAREHERLERDITEVEYGSVSVPVTGVADRGTSYMMSSEALIGLTPEPLPRYEGPELPDDDTVYEGPELPPRAPPWIGPAEGPKRVYTDEEVKSLVAVLSNLDAKSSPAAKKLGKKALAAAARLAAKTGSEEVGVVKETAASDSKRDMKAARKRAVKNAKALEEKTGVPVAPVVEKPSEKPSEKAAKKPAAKKPKRKAMAAALPAPKRASRKGKLVRTYKRIVCTPSGAKLRKINVRKKLRQAA